MDYTKDEMTRALAQLAEFNIASTYKTIRQKDAEVEWYSQVWNPYIHPRPSGNTWNIFQNYVATDDNN